MSSYVVLARRWRPRTFAALVGQGHVTQALSHALSTGRVPHAFLFCGIRGVGKTTLARLLAMCLNCEEGVTAQPCGQCTSCRQIIAGNHPDVLEIDAASRTKVEQMREVLDMVGYSPAVSRFRLFILDEVHMLSNQSFNALLKTLEEPPSHVKFLFATTEARKIPATILSRCQRYDLKRVSREQLTGHLQHVLQQEGVEYELQAVDAVVRSAEGSVRDALSLLDQVIAHGAGTVRYDAVRDLLGLTDPEAIVQLLESLLCGRGEETLQQAQNFYVNGVEAESLLRELLDTLHRASRRKLLAAEPVQEREEGVAHRLLQLTHRVSMEHLQMAYQVLLRGSADLRLAEDALQALEMLLLRVAYLKPVPSLERLLGLMEGHEPPPPATTGRAPAVLQEGSARREESAPTPKGGVGQNFSALPVEPKTSSATPKPLVESALPPVTQPVSTLSAPVAPLTPASAVPPRLHSWRQMVDYMSETESELAVKLERLVSCPHYGVDKDGVPQRIDLQLASDVYGSAEQMRHLVVDFLRKNGLAAVVVTMEQQATGNKRCETLAENEQRRQRDHVNALTAHMQEHPMVQQIMERFQAVMTAVRPLGEVGSS
ncbi:MAG: DNA polymerase III subunit gamma/tau [Magnetococcales bacterium]|nr:DNA polymerase III subunit gamma/tau [Magnetococcales bacterium]MBF0113478.1 DNA polymerase III subunit gamma/tau [Magnetococcales bacterium]